MNKMFQRDASLNPGNFSARERERKEEEESKIPVERWKKKKKKKWREKENIFRLLLFDI
jgi:Zn-finger nucleic acid-binding protein